MSFFTLRFHLVICAVLLLGASSGYAQSNEDRAYELATQGAELFGSGEYREAARHFEEAYALLKDSVLLKNQIVSLYKAGDCPVALDLAYNYDISYRDAPVQDKEDVRKVRVDCNLLAAETAIGYGKLDVARESLDRAKGVGLVEDEVARHDELRAKVDTEQTKNDTPLPVEPEESTTAWRPIVGWSLVGVGVGVTALSAVFHVGDKGRYEELDCANAKCSEADIEEYNDIADGEYRWVLGYGLGGAMIVGGVVLLLTGDEAQGVTLIPQIGPRDVGAAVHLRF